MADAKSTPSYPPASEASREVENFDWKKIHMPPYMVSKNLSVCLSVTKFNPNYLRTGRIEQAKIFFTTSLSKSHVSKKNFLGKGPVGPGPRAKICFALKLYFFIK